MVPGVRSLKCPLAPPPPIGLRIPTPQDFYSEDGAWRALNSTPNLGFTPLGLPRPGLRLPTRFYSNARRACCSGRGTAAAPGSSLRGTGWPKRRQWPHRAP